MALAVLFTTLITQTMPVAAEDIDSSLRAWFDFNENHFLGRDRLIFDVLTFDAEETDTRQVFGAYGTDVTVVDGLNGNALKFNGSVSSLNEMASLSCKSAFYIQSNIDLFAGDNVTINIVYKEDTVEQTQPVFYAGLTPTEFFAIKTSSATDGIGPQVAINNSGALDEQKVSASADAIPQTGTWNMLTIVQEGTTLKIYINGNLVQTATMNYKLGDINSVVSNTNGYALGAPSPYNDLSKFLEAVPNFDAPGFKGLVDDFRVYGAALAEDEIKELAVSLHIGAESEEVEDGLNAYAINMFGLVVKDSYDDVGGVAVPDNPGDNTDGIGNVHNNAWVKVPTVAFGEAGATNITLKYCAKESRMGKNGKVAIWVDGKSASENGTLIGQVDLPITGTEYSQFSTITAELLNKVTGTHDVYFVFTADTTEANPYVANMSYFQFGPIPAADEDAGHEELVSSTVIDWNFADEDSYAGISLGNGVTIENGKATFAPGNEGIALPDDIFKDAETVTIEMTLQPSAFANYRALLCGGNQKGKWFVMGVMADGAVRYAIATNGDDASEAKGNTTASSEGNKDATYQSGATLTTDKEYVVKYVITQTETNVYIDGELAMTMPTPNKDAIGAIGGPVVLGKATKWPDSSYEGTISNFKVTIEKMEWVAGEGDGSDEGNDNEGGSNDSTGDSDEDNSTTGDVASVAALLLAGVAALGGFALRKRTK